MLVSQFLLATVKETPSDAEIISHQLMIRAGMVRKLASGLYTWLPLGLRVLRKVERIVREEMDRSGALEMLMPAIQPAELWQESKRWNCYGKELLRITDRHDREFCFGPTHEEVITDLARFELKSYKQLPIVFYQIQTKFRDEIRPRFGVMRAREFLMKDAYSFHMDDASLQDTYQIMFDAYQRIFTRLGLKFRSVFADTGTIGGKRSHEFQVLASTGEDTIVYSDESDYAANMELAKAQAPQISRPQPSAEMEKIATPGLKTIKALAENMNIPATQSVKTLMVKGEHDPMVALILRGDHELNEIKAAHLDNIASPLTFVSDEEIVATVGCGPGSLGPVGLTIPVIVDRDAAVLADFVCGANEEGFHFTHVNWERDVTLGEVVDLRKVVQGDVSPDGRGHLQFTRGIEVGHIFQLGDKYSRTMGLVILDEKGQPVMPLMGSYGLGLSRVVAAAIEQNHDKYGIIWPNAMAPFDVALLPVQMHKSYRVREASEALYQNLTEAGYAVLFDDRKERLGVMFADLDLIGIPHRLVVGERGLDQGKVEYKARTSSETELWPMDDVISRMKEQF